jgi:hypothetical protein
MAIGDSVTRATCWRAALWEHLQQSFPDRFDLVGTLSSDNGCTPANYDRDNQGYSSSLVTEIAAGITNARTCDPSPCPTLSDLQQAFAAQTPDVALIHFGTNDVWNAKPSEDIVNAYSAVVDSLRAANPQVVIFVAQIIPMHVTDMTCSGCSCANCATDVPALDARIVTWAAEHDTRIHRSAPSINIRAMIPLSTIVTACTPTTRARRKWPIAGSMPWRHCSATNIAESTRRARRQALPASGKVAYGTGTRAGAPTWVLPQQPSLPLNAPRCRGGPYGVSAAPPPFFTSLGADASVAGRGRIVELVTGRRADDATRDRGCSAHAAGGFAAGPA